MHRKPKKPLTFLIIKNPQINQRRINRKRNTCIQYILVDKRTPQQIPIGIQYKQQPPPKQKTNQKRLKPLSPVRNKKKFNRYFSGIGNNL